MTETISVKPGDDLQGIIDAAEPYAVIELEPGTYSGNYNFVAGKSLTFRGANAGINPNTAERAFAELERRGLVMTIPKKGVFVCTSGELLVHEEAKRQLRAIRQAGLSKDELLALIEEIYEEEGK